LAGFTNCAFLPLSAYNYLVGTAARRRCRKASGVMRASSSKRLIGGAILLALTIGLIAGGDAFSVQREQMVRQIEDRGVRSPDTLHVMRATLRHLFLPSDLQYRAYEDRPLPIGYDATISQPYIVALMTELLEPAKPEFRS